MTFRTAAIVSAMLLAIAAPPGAPAVSAAEGVSKPLLPRGRSFGVYQRRAIERLLAPGAAAAADSLRVCVIRVYFADREFIETHGSYYFGNELRHLSEYWHGASRGAFALSCDLRPEVVRLAGDEAYYGNDELWSQRMAEILIQVVQETDGAIDFGAYDAVAIIHADAGRETDFKDDSRYQLLSGFVSPEEMAEALADTLGTPGVPTNDGAPGDTLYLDNLMVWPEWATQDGYTFGALGVYAYQVGLRLGMIPLYDTTPADFPDSQGCGNFDLMGYGIYNALGFVPAFPSAFNRYLMGWGKAIEVVSDADVTLPDVNATDPDRTAIVKVPINPSEYYLIENRVHDANFNGRFDFGDLNGNGVPENEDSLLGAEFDFFITATSNPRPAPDSVVTGSGLLVWHVDETAIRRALDAGGYPNDDRAFKGVDLEEADGIQDLDLPGGGYDFGSYLDAFRAGNNNRFADDTDPSSRTNGGAPSGIAVQNVSAAGPEMSFSVRFASALGFHRGEVAASLGALAPVVMRSSVDGPDRVVMAADSGRILVAEAGGGSWDGAIEELVREPGAEWMCTPVSARDGFAGIFVIERGGVLRRYAENGTPLTIDDDATPFALQLRGNVRGALMAADVDGDAEEEILAFSSTADSTYVCVLGATSYPAGAKRMGPFGWEFGVVDGRLAALPASAYRDGEEYPSGPGVYVATWRAPQGLRYHMLHFLVHYIPPLPDVSAIAGVTVEPRNLSALAAGDIDGDGRVEMAAAFEGGALQYFDGDGSLRRVELRGDHPSSPVLADLDGDGTLETILRDESHIYVFSGFGVAATGWPRAIDAPVASAYVRTAAVPPVIGDVDGDGRPDIVVRVGGDLWAYDRSGRAIAGWPLPGEGASGGGLALLRTEAGALRIADVACLEPVAPDGARGAAVASLRAYETERDFPGGQVWPSFRHDGRGSGRQLRSAAEAGSRPLVEPRSFIVYPNPVHGPRFTVRLALSKPARVTVTILNMEGEKVAAIERSHDWPAGSAVPFEAAFDAGAFASGIYIARVEATASGERFADARKFAVVR